MTATDQTTLQPDQASMATALEHAFGGWLDGLHDGLIEITYVENQGAGKPRERWIGAMFGTDGIDDAAEYAARMNRLGHNIYFAPALRKPGIRTDRRASKPDVLGTLMLWAEWDDADAFNSAMERVQFCKPTMGCVTGVIPTKRAQAMWRLNEAITSPDEIDAALRGLATALGGDPKVVHADCLMRLPGSISWRKLNKPERVDEVTTLRIGFSDRPSIYPTGQVLKAYPPIVASEKSAGFEHADYKYTHGPLGLQGELADGRELYMRNTLCAVLIEFIGRNGAAPTAEELMDIAWGQYASKVDFSRPGRDAKEMHDKCIYTIQRFHAGRIPGARTLEEAAASWRRKQERQQQSGRSGATPPPGSGPTGAPEDVFELLSLADLEALPPASWLVEKWLPEGGFSIMYGPSRSLKSFIALDLLLHVATDRQWHSHPVKGGPVLYICGEGYAGIAKRAHAWRLHYQASSEAPFRMTRHAVAFDDPQMVERLIRTIKSAERTAGHTFVAICVDTVARAFGAGDENATKDMNRFIAACDRVRAVTGAAVLGVHHTGKDKERGMRGSSSLPGAMDSTIKVERTESIVVITNEKQKDDEEAQPKIFKTHKIEWQSGIKPVSSLVLLPADWNQAERPRAMSKQQRRILDLLIEAVVREGQAAPVSDHIPARAKVVHIQTWKDYVRAGVVSDSENAESSQKAFKRASDILISDGHVGKWQEFVWVIQKSDNRT